MLKNLLIDYVNCIDTKLLDNISHNTLCKKAGIFLYGVVEGVK